MSGDAERSPIYIVLSTFQVIGYGLAGAEDDPPFIDPLELPPVPPEEPPEPPVGPPD